MIPESEEVINERLRRAPWTFLPSKEYVKHKVATSNPYKMYMWFIIGMAVYGIVKPVAIKIYQRSTQA